MELRFVLKKLRESRGISIKKLSELAGVGNGTIGEIERGQNNSKPITLQKISRALNLNKIEKEELFSCLVPDGLKEKENKKTQKELDEFLQEASLFFNNDGILEEDKKKMVDSLTEMFYDAKARNKKK